MAAAAHPPLAGYAIEEGRTSPWLEAIAGGGHPAVCCAPQRVRRSRGPARGLLGAPARGSARCWRRGGAAGLGGTLGGWDPPAVG